MRQLIIIVALFGCYFSAFAQTNSFPPTGGVGIGTTSPLEALDVRGNAFISGKIMSLISGPDIGGHLELRNPAKTANGAASNWTIFNMGGTYGNSLQFWAYDNLGCASGGMCTNRFTIMDNGNVGVGTATPTDKLSVKGKIRAQEIKVETNGWADFVFAKDYKLPSLQATEQHILANGHLPGIPSAAEVAKDGIELGEMNKKLLQKIEELTLYLISNTKQLDSAVKKIGKLEAETEKIKTKP
ncbi:MAG: hypothetical protein V4594_25000 [Bacteroidota bacterium]